MLGGVDRRVFVEVPEQQRQPQQQQPLDFEVEDEAFVGNPLFPVWSRRPPPLSVAAFQKRGGGIFGFFYYC
jgi:hypothetical protein